MFKKVPAKLRSLFFYDKLLKYDGGKRLINVKAVGRGNFKQ